MSGLELDGRFESPSTSPVKEEEYKYPYHLPDGLQVSYPEKPSSCHPRHVFGFRFTTFILSVALATVTLLTIVAAGVGGSLAARNTHKYLIPSPKFQKDLKS